MSDKQSLGPNQTFWLKELRSGKYEQGIGFLCKETKYCCLGVGSEIFKTNAIKIHTGILGHKFYDGSMSIAPFYLGEALGLFGSLGESKTFYQSSSDPKSLSSYNDQGKTFAEIADIIEQDPSVYFQEPR